MGLFPEIRKKRSEWTRTVPFHIDENIIQRDFHADKPNQKWFTDVSCLFYGNHQKAYLSAIIDRYDMSIVSYVISQRNDNQLVIDTVKMHYRPILTRAPLFIVTEDFNICQMSTNF
ncbi:DDE-type integrase/transposase/recombinase [Listeria fleischmannii]